MLNETLRRASSEVQEDGSEKECCTHSAQTELNPADQISIPRHNCCSPGDECYRKSRECEGLQNVLMDAIRKRTGMCCIQWKDDEFVNQMPRTSKAARREILTVL